MSVPKVKICDETVTAGTVQGLLAAEGVPLRDVALGRISPDPVKLRSVPRFDAFLGDVPPPPASKSWVNAAAKASLKQMYGNDQYGDCVIASIGHGVGVSSANESGTAVVGTTQELVNEYFRVCGPNDDGCVITDTKDAMMAGGISVGGQKRKIDGYAAVPPGNPTAVKTAILLAGGGVNIGFNVPSEWMGSNTYDGAVWDTPRRLNFIGGHDVRAVGYDERGVQFSTWGIVVTMTWAALADSRIVDEMYVELEKDWNSDGTAPSGLDTAGLAAALAVFKAGKVPDWRPPTALALSVSPSSGAAPLSVTFTGTTTGTGATLDFGDGSQPKSVGPNFGQISVPYTYTKPGTYTAVLDQFGSQPATTVVTVSQVGPPPPPPPGGLTGTETNVYSNGAIMTRTFVPGKPPVVTGDTHEIDLSGVGPLRRLIVRRKILALLEDSPEADVAAHGDKIVVTRADGIDWNNFLDFLTKLLPIILQIIKIFGG